MYGNKEENRRLLSMMTSGRASRSKRKTKTLALFITIFVIKKR
jgi:hypothetical protein